MKAQTNPFAMYLRVSPCPSRGPLRLRPGEAGSVDEAIMECEEVRIFAGRRAANQEAIRACPIPPNIRQLCE